MKTTIIASIFLLITIKSKADLIAGPITNPANGHDYYLLSPDTWTEAETEAESLGGTLAIIRNADEEKWVYSTFGAYGGTNRDLWIGLHRQWQGGPFVWVSGEKPQYYNWAPGEPNNAGGAENCAVIWGDNRAVASDNGFWDDTPDASYPYGVAEIQAKFDKKTLTEKEKVLIGTWYEGGRPDKPCWIAGTENMLFVISNGRQASRAGFCADGSLFIPDFREEMPSGLNGFDGGYPFSMHLQTSVRGEIAKDKILWSNGTWWSRKPSN